MKFPGLVWVLFAAVLTPALGAAPSAMQRDLHYTITMNGKPVGSSEVSVEPEREGRVTLRSRTRIDIKSLLFSYHYAATAHETWSGDRLVSGEAESVADGEISRTRITRAADTVMVITDQGERHLTGDVASTSFWNLPRLPDAMLTFLDVETGADFRSQARFVKETEITINGSAIPCRLWQLSGGAKTQLWFDHDDVLLRVEYEEQGQRFTHTLNRLAAASSKEQQ